MKVVHLTTTDLGGSYKAVERIHRGLQLNQVESKILLRTKHHADNIGDEVIHTPIQKLISRTKNVGNMILSRGEVHAEHFGTDMSKHPEVKSADVIILHWVNSFLGYHQVEKLVSLGKPVIWVAHDMWVFTGGCHCDRYCGRFAEGCGSCPLIAEKSHRDITAKNCIRKKNAFKNITLVTPSKCYALWAKDSIIWKNHRVESIFNPIDYEMFRILENKEELRKQYGISSDKKVILFGSVGALSDQNKGIQNLLKALKNLPEHRYQLVVFGNKENERLVNSPMTTTYLGYIHKEAQMREIYNLADVFLAPSEQESFCYTVGEALACGIPAVGYRIGGIAEQITDRVNGYLAEYGRPEELAEGVRYCTEHEMKRKDNHNSLMEIGKKYKELCASMLGKDGEFD